MVWLSIGKGYGVSILNIFHLMKSEMMDEHFENPESLAQAMTESIEFYNNRRIRTKLKGKSPVKYRELANQLIA
ncbi:IS3 family transposase [Weissella paramesenteroides]|uniref:IS3 family transposase n=1 Tax=Weissella paramesenteroides TaxID=1249 RepID=UPI003D361F30